MSEPLRTLPEVVGSDTVDSVLPALIRLVDLVSRAGALPQILEGALDVLDEALGPDRSSVQLLDDSRAMRFRAFRRLSEDCRSAVDGRAPWRPDTLDAAPVLVPDVSQDHSLERLVPVFDREGIRALAFVPLTSAGRLVGMVTLCYDAPHAFSTHEVDVARTIAAQVGFAVERRQIEDRLMKLSHDLEEAVSARDVFLGVASHELRTPLTTLQLHLESMCRRPPPGLDARSQTRLESAVTQVHRLGRLVDELLDVTRVNAHQLRLERERFELRELAAEALRRLEPELTRAGCQCALVAEGDTEGEWDRLRIDQVISNLLTNAIKYGAGSAVTVRVEGTPQAVRLSVEDEGIGIPPEDQERIFDRYERAGASRIIGGFGLGLWIVQQIVTAHGGTISVKSEAGRGSIFLVDLPRD